MFAQQSLQSKLSRRRYASVSYALHNNTVRQFSKAHRTGSVSVMGHELTMRVSSTKLFQKQQNIFGRISLFWSVALQGHPAQQSGVQTPVRTVQRGMLLDDYRDDRERMSHAGVSRFLRYSGSMGYAKEKNEAAHHKFQRRVGYTRHHFEKQSKTRNVREKTALTKLQFIIEVRRLKWSGHVSRKNNGRLLKQGIHWEANTI